MTPAQFFIGESDIARRVRDQAVACAAHDRPVLIVGPEGSGRRRLARLIHDLSSRAGGPRKEFDCGTADNEGLERRLRGLTATAAGGQTDGLFRGGANGTVLLLNLDQASEKCRRILERTLGDRMVVPADSDGDGIPLNCRVIGTATLNAGADRLLQLFPKEPIRLFGIDERREDIPALVRYFLAEWNASYEKKLDPPDSSLMTRLSRIRWARDAAEIREAVREAVAGCGDRTGFTADLLPAHVCEQLANGAPPDLLSTPTPDGDRMDQEGELSRLLTEQMLATLRAGGPLPTFGLRCAHANLKTHAIVRLLRRAAREAVGRFVATDSEMRECLTTRSSNVVLRKIGFPDSAEGNRPGKRDALHSSLRREFVLLFKELRARQNLLNDIADGASVGDVVPLVGLVPTPDKVGDVIKVLPGLIENYRQQHGSKPTRRVKQNLLKEVLGYTVSAGLVSKAEKRLGLSRKAGSGLGRTRTVTAVDLDNAAARGYAKPSSSADGSAPVDIQEPSDRYSERLRDMHPAEIENEARKFGLDPDAFDKDELARLLIENWQKVIDLVAAYEDLPEESREALLDQNGVLPEALTLEQQAQRIYWEEYWKRHGNA